MVKHKADRLLFQNLISLASQMAPDERHSLKYLQREERTLIILDKSKAEEKKFGFCDRWFDDFDPSKVTRVSKKE